MTSFKKIGTWGWVVGVLAGLVAASGAGAEQARAEAPPEPLPLRAFFEPPLMREPQLSPDGRKLAMFVRRGDAEGAAILDLATGQLELQGGDGADALDLRWNGAEELILRIGDRKREHFGVVGIDLKTGKRHDYWRLNKTYRRVLDGLHAEPGKVLVRDTFETRTFDLRSGRMQAASPRAPVGVARWVLDDAGEARAAYGVGTEVLFLLWRAPGAKSWTQATSSIDERAWLPVGAARDSRYVWVVEHAGADARGLLQLDTVTGQIDREVRRAGASPVGYWWNGPNGRVLAAVFCENGRQVVEALEPEEAGAVATLMSKLQGFLVDVVSAPPGVPRWVVKVSNSRVPAAYFLFDTTSGALSALGVAHGPELPESRLVAARPVGFKVRDGSTRTGLLWLPPGVERPPLVMQLPGFMPQPIARDLYEPDIQALVSRGIAVARINIRGTAGFGRVFEEAPLADLARVAGNDLEDAVKALAGAGLIDGEKVAIGGVALGGALALAVAERSTVFSAVVNAEAPLEISRDSLRLFGLTLTADAVRDELGGWKEEGEAARRLSPAVVAPALKVPALHLYPEDAAFGGRVNQEGKRLEGLVAGNPGGARVEINERYSDDRKLPTVVADERAEVVGRVIEFLRSAWAAGGE